MFQNDKNIIEVDHKIGENYSSEIEKLYFDATNM
jgi:hypothetical protein